MARTKSFRSNPPIENSLARPVSKAGWVASFSSHISSIGFTKPRPKYWAQTRLTIDLLKNGFSAVQIQSPSTGRYGLPLVNFAASPPRNLAGTLLADSGSGLPRRLGLAVSETLL